MFPIRLILHPTDFSPPSDYAFRLAASLARDHDARLVLLHVVSPVAVAEERSWQAPSDDPYEKLWEAFRQMEKSDPRIRELDVRSELETGDPLTKILCTAEVLGCDLIVMGTHGRTGLSHLLMGSIAEQVVRKAPCPVLTVKTPLPHEQPSGEPVADEERRYWETAKL